ncbi:MAG TPA: tetratricopeptide repeat protein [Polyangia bacterium]|jgi:tetratricopeptide (TPR) repeat protein|nr:tetratricopeptide repeat protein [Polyangia bacterium]
MTEGDDVGDRAAALHERALALRAAGAFSEAAEAVGEAVALFERAEGCASPNLANALIDHGDLLASLDRLDESANAGERAIAILRPLIRTSAADADADVQAELVRIAVRAHTTRAVTHRMRGDLAEAEAGCRSALALAEARLPADDLLTAEALNSLAVVHKFQGRYADAEALYRRALAIVDRAGDDRDRAMLLHNLGGLAHARGDHAAGEPLARQSVELRERLLGADHPTTAADRAAWAALLEGVGRLAEAERAYADALAVFERRLGAHSLEVASTLTGLAGVQRARGAAGDAERAYRRALAIREARLPAEHFDLGITLNNLAMVLLDRGAEDEAAPLLRRAHAVFTAALGPQHPHTGAVASTLDSLKPSSSTAR